MCAGFRSTRRRACFAYGGEREMVERARTKLATEDL